MYARLMDISVVMDILTKENYTHRPFIHIYAYLTYLAVPVIRHLWLT